MKFFYYAAIACMALSLGACKDEEPQEEVVETIEVFPVVIGKFEMDEAPKELSERLLDMSDISDLSKREIRILRNAIYAMHNRKFISNDLNDYFGMFEWYKPLYNDYQITLNTIEAKNIQFLARYD